jgi:hypothetical protein
MEFLGPHFLDWDGSSPLPKMDDKTLKNSIIQSLTVSYNSGSSRSYTRNFGKDHLSHLRHRHGKYGVTNIDHVLTHFAKLPKSIPPFLITHYVKLIGGASNYDGGRRRKFAPDESLHPDKTPSNPWPCYLCAQGDMVSPGNNENHLFRTCACVNSAWLDVLMHPNGPRDDGWVHHFANKVSPLFIIDYPETVNCIGYCRLALIMAFCWAVYKVVGQIRMGRCAEGAGERVVSLTILLRNIWAPVKKKK